MKRHRKRRQNRQNKTEHQRRKRIIFGARLAFFLFEAAVNRVRDRVNQQVIKQFKPGGIITHKSSAHKGANIDDFWIDENEYIVPTTNKA